ncbi:MAG: ABC transporter permease [Beijerinckiaceae bacterium]
MNRWEPFEWITAIRFLKEGRMQTLFIIVGVAIGVSVIIFMASLMTGLQANFVKQILSSQPHIQILPAEDVARPLRSGGGIIAAATIQKPAQRLRSIDQWQTIQRMLRERPDVVAASPTVSAAALAIRGDASQSITITGIEPESYFRIVRLPDYIVQGSPDLTSEDIIIGIELAKELSVTLGDKLNIRVGSGISRALTIRAIFDLGNKGSNTGLTFLSLRTAQSLSGLVGGATAINVNLTDPYAAEDVAVVVQAATGVQADSWIKTFSKFFEIIRTQNISFGSIEFFVGLSVAFGMASVLVVSVIQRSKDIGILRAMGTTRPQIVRVFLLQGGILSFVGAIGGSLLGAAGVLLFRSVITEDDGSQPFQLLMEPQLFMIVIALATVTGFAAAVFPALRAAKLDPVVAMRG